MLALKKPFILASGSPRRQHLLRQLGMPFEVRESGVDEQFDSTKTPAENVTMLAEHKAGAVAKTIPNGIILGADTTVVLHGAVLNKPEDAHDARRMLNELSGNTHTVFTGIALIDKPSGKRVAAVEQTEVTFRRLSQEEIREYVEAGSPMDKAGAYGIQDDYGATFVQKIDGCFYNVVGLPVSRFYMLLNDFLKQLD